MGAGLRRRALVAGFPVAVAALNLAKLGPLRADISGPELRRAGLRAFGEVLARLDVTARTSCSATPIAPGRCPATSSSSGERRPARSCINSGCWVHEPGFLGSRPDQSPYRVGFAVVLDDDGPPRLLNLLDGVTPPDRA